jgi:hypothetical protein
MVDVAKTNPDMVTLENKYNSLDDKQKQELNDYM